MRRTPFNMIEVLLALGVIGIGAVSVLALFPYGFSSTRDSMAESFAGDSADQFLHWFAAKAQADWDNYAGSSSGGWELPTATALPLTETTSWSGDVPITPNLIYNQNSTVKGLVKVRFQRGDSAQPMVDFSGIYRIWKDTVELPYLRSDGTAGTQSLDTNSAVAINIEASWPSEIPYERRRKAVYRLEVFRDGP